jgi:transposase
MDPEGFFLSTVDTASPWVGATAFPVQPRETDPVNRATPSCCPVCGNPLRNYDAKEQQRRRLSAMLSAAYLPVAVSRPATPDHTPDSTKIEVPWARPGTGFTQMFEALVMALLRQIPVKVAAAVLDTGDKRLWRCVAREDGTQVTRGAFGSPGMERRSGREGRDYLNLFYDLEVSFEIPARAEPTVRASAGQLTAPRGNNPGLVANLFKLSRALILAAVTLRAAAALASHFFRVITNRNAALGKVGAEEGMLFPLKSRAPPGAVLPA